MKFVDLEVRTKRVIHGYDSNNKEIKEVVDEQVFVRKLVAVSRIQSISEQFVLVTSSHDRVMYWEYNGTLEQLREKLATDDLVAG